MRSNLRKIWNLLTPKQRKSALSLFILMLGSMALEMVGIALIVPILGILNGRLFLAELLPLEMPQLAFICMGALIGFYVFKSMYLALFNWRRARFIFTLQADLSDWVLAKFLDQPIEFHFNSHSSELSRKAIHDTAQFARGTVMSCLTIAAEFCILLGVTTILLIYQPLFALCTIAALSIISAAVYRLWRDRLYRWGKLRQTSESQTHQYMQEALTAVRDIKLSKSETAFVNRYSIPSHNFANVASKQTSLESIPRIGLELLSVTGISMLAIALIFLETEYASIVPIIAVFALAFSRMLPATSRLLNHFNYLRFSTPIVDSLATTIVELNAHTNTHSVSEEILDIVGNWKRIELQRVSYRYPSGNAPAVENANLQIERGECIGIVGPTGSGKSTVIDVVLGLLKPQSGRATVDGQEIVKVATEWHRIIGYVPQRPTLINDSIVRNIAFGVAEEALDHARLRQSINLAELTDVVDSLDQGIQTIVGEQGERLSGGQCQRIAIARALYRKPQVLILDEATNAIDAETEESILHNLLSLKPKPTILIVGHRETSTAICERVYNLGNLRNSQPSD